MTVKLPFMAAAMSLAMAAPAAATIIIDTGAGDVQPDENLLFSNDPPPGLEVTGVTNNTDTFVSLLGGETLVGNGGQARLEADDGLISTGFTYNGLADQHIAFDLVDAAQAFTQTEFRVFVGRGTATSATLTFVDTDGEVFTQTFDIPANGFFNATTADGQLIDHFSLAFNGSVQDIRQIRLGGLAGLVTPIPEPATWAMMILGFGAAGAVMRRRRAFA